MAQVNILDARNNLSRLVAVAVNGGEVVIANRGTPVVRLVPIDAGALRHTAAQAAEWLTLNLVPTHASRTTAELDEQIITERQAWE